MTRDEALRDVRGYAAAGRAKFSRHAYARMDQRGATERDVRNACARAMRCRSNGERGPWRATGPDTHGDELDVVVVFDDGLVVLTIF